MGSISGISAGLIQSYERFQKVTSLTTENMFQMLSLELGGDGESITRDQLDSYIQQADEGDIDISNQEFDSLLELQENWDSIAGKGSESITGSDMSDYRDILFSAVTGGITMGDNSSSSNSAFIEDVDAYIVEQTLGASISDLSSMLNSLLTGSNGKDDEENAGSIASLINLIANSASSSTVEVEA